MAQLSGAAATVFIGIAAQEVSRIDILLRDGRTLRVTPFTRSPYPVKFYVQALPGRPAAKSFIARDREGDVLERNPRPASGD
ncbi:MAG: hypothetical protein ACRDI0_07470 [Actinomycetota bacterium]